MGTQSISIYSAPTGSGPVISSLQVTSITDTSAIVSWSLDEPATGQVDYGPTNAYGSQTTPEQSFNYSNHAQQITGLTEGTTYHFRVHSANQGGFTTYSGDGTFTTTTPPPSFPADTSLSFTSRPSIPALPTYLSSFSDPTWGTHGIRISNVAGQRHVYARYAAWNFDQSLLYQGFTFPGRMRDGSTYADMGSFSGLSGAVWCKQSNKMYGVDGGGANLLYQQLVNADGTSGGTSVKRTFAAGTTVWIGGDSGSWEGGISDDDRYLCISVLGGAGGDRLQVIDLQTNTIVGDRAKPANMDNAQISADGNWVVVVGNGETRVWPRDLTGSGRQLWANDNHGDNGRNGAGESIFVSNNAVVGGVVGVWSYRLSDGATTKLLPSGTAFANGHTSGSANINRPGWIYLTAYDPTFGAGKPGFDQIVAVKTDGSQTVEVFGFSNHNENATYADQPHGVPSPDGQRVCVASEWGSGSPGSVYDFVYSV